jgi:hypothetical protein
MGLTFNEQAHEYRLDGAVVPSVTQVLCPGGVPPWAQHGAERGTAVHDAAHYLLENDLDESSVDPVVKPYLAAFRQWVEDVSPEILASEVAVFSPRYWYAGRLDLVARVFGRLLVIDIKTGSAVPPWADAQVEAYRRAYEETSTVRRVTGCRTLLLDADGRYRFRPAGGPLAWAHFQVALQASKEKEHAPIGDGGRDRAGSGARKRGRDTVAAAGPGAAGPR